MKDLRSLLLQKISKATMWLYIIAIPLVFSLGIGVPSLIKSGKRGKVFLWEWQYENRKVVSYRPKK